MKNVKVKSLNTIPDLIDHLKEECDHVADSFEKLPDESKMLMIKDMGNRAITYSKMSKEEIEKAIQECTRIIGSAFLDQTSLIIARSRIMLEEGAAKGINQ